MVYRAPKCIWLLLVPALAVCSASRSVLDFESAATEARLAAVDAEAAAKTTGGPADEGSGDSPEDAPQPIQLVPSFDPWDRTVRSAGGERVGSPDLIPIRAVRPRTASVAVALRCPHQVDRPPEAIHQLAPLWPCGPPRRC